MRVVYVSITPLPHIGGMSTLIEELSAGLTARGHRVSVASPAQFPQLWNVLTDKMSGLARKVFRLWIWFFIRLMLTGWALHVYVSHLLKEQHIDVVDAQDPVAYLAVRGPARRHGTAAVLTVHGYFHHEATNGAIESESLWEKMLLRIERRAYRKARHVVSVDSRIGRHVLKSASPETAVTIRRNFVDPAKFGRGDMLLRERTLRRLGADPRKKVLCCARRLEKKCGIEYAIRAMRILIDSGHDLTLLVVGRGTEEERLRELVRSMTLDDSVLFLGELDREAVRTILQTSDVALVPSISVGEEVEATSLSALEAMATGTPVVASGIGGLRELITDGETGFLVPEKDAEALAEAVLRALEPIGSTMAARAMEAVRLQFSSTSGVDSTLALYRVAISQRPE